MPLFDDPTAQALGAYRGAPDLQKASFAGPKANLNDQERRAFETAQRMEKQGRSREEIWRETGKLGAPWWKDSHGQWWMEFSDDKAKLKGTPYYRAEPKDSYDQKTKTYRSGPDMDAWMSPNTTLGEVYDNPDYHRLYPKTKKLPVGINDLQGLTGAYTPEKQLKPGEKPKIEIDPYELLGEDDKRDGPYDLAKNAERKGPTGSLLDVFVHEGQHVLQDEEKSFKGDPDHFPGEATPVEIHAALAEIRRKMTMQERLQKPPWLMEEAAKEWYSRKR